jgi:2-oxoisovalerate dehydrogenase E1 component
VNHATALAGINTARYARRIGLPAPILFVCEDNERGISVDTPAGWVEDLYGSARHLEYVVVDAEIDDAWELVRAAVARCRASRAPVFVHLRCVRLWGHAGSDPELTYRTLRQVEADEARDPLLRSARRLVELGVARPATLARLVVEIRRHACQLADEVAARPRLTSRAAVMAPLAAWDGAAVLRSATRSASAEERRRAFADGLPEERRLPNARTLAAHVNAALADELARRPQLVVFGEDVGRKGGVYNVTAGLQRTFGAGRVFDTLLDETSILGLAEGFALAGLLPVPEIQYLAYLHNALDQIRGEAASLAFFSNGQFRNPMVVRVASFGYQKGFGGHFHNDNSIGALRDIPGLLLAAPSRGDDAARLLRGCIAAADACGRVTCFLEPIALYHEKDLYEPGDGAWLSDYPPPGSALLPGEVGRYGPREATLLIVSYANGLRLSLQAARLLEREHGIAARVVDLRWLSPLPFDAVRHEASVCGRVLVVDECRATGGGIADALVADLAEHRFAGPMTSLRSADSYVPLGPAAESVLVSRDEIVAAARSLAA